MIGAVSLSHIVLNYLNCVVFIFCFPVFGLTLLVLT
jgi:hypothetical protein